MNAGVFRLEEPVCFSGRSVVIILLFSKPHLEFQLGFPFSTVLVFSAVCEIYVLHLSLVHLSVLLDPSSNVQADILLPVRLQLPFDAF